MSQTLILSTDADTVVVMLDGEPIAQLDWDANVTVAEACKSAVEACGYGFVNNHDPEPTANGWDIEVVVEA